jgi:hypothetical protein
MRRRVKSMELSKYSKGVPVEKGLPVFLRRL